MPKLGNKIFVFPVLIQKTSTRYNTAPDITIRWRKSKNVDSVGSKSKMGVTMKTTTYTLDLLVFGKRKQWSFVWRPDVTRYWWKHKRIEKEKKL